MTGGRKLKVKNFGSKVSTLPKVSLQLRAFAKTKVLVPKKYEFCPHFVAGFSRFAPA